MEINGNGFETTTPSALRAEHPFAREGELRQSLNSKDFVEILKIIFVRVKDNGKGFEPLPRQLPSATATPVASEGNF
jgi:hypothetical protein